MLEWIAFACLIGAIILLVILAVIDLRTFLLPNELVVGFATLGLIFHLTTLATWLPVHDIILGGVLGFGSLFLLRMAANKYYGTDALGLGDVKLIGAAGIWLGPEGVMIALSAGAFASLLHGMGVALVQARRDGSFPDLGTLRIPAGPGFVAGIILAGILQYRTFTPFVTVMP